MMLYRQIDAAFSAAVSYRRWPRLCRATYARSHSYITTEPIHPITELLSLC